MDEEVKDDPRPLSEVSMQYLVFARQILQGIITLAEQENNPLLDHPELRDNRPGAREQLATVEEEISYRQNNPIDQIVGLNTLELKGTTPKI